MKHLTVLVLFLSFAKTITAAHALEPASLDSLVHVQLMIHGNQVTRECSGTIISEHEVLSIRDCVPVNVDGFVPTDIRIETQKGVAMVSEARIIEEWPRQVLETDWYKNLNQDEREALRIQMIYERAAILSVKDSLLRLGSVANLTETTQFNFGDAKLALAAKLPDLAPVHRPSWDYRIIGAEPEKMRTETIVGTRESASSYLDKIERDSLKNGLPRDQTDDIKRNHQAIDGKFAFYMTFDSSVLYSEMGAPIFLQDGKSDEVVGVAESINYFTKDPATWEICSNEDSIIRIMPFSKEHYRQMMAHPGLIVVRYSY